MNATLKVRVEKGKAETDNRNENNCYSSFLFCSDVPWIGGDLYTCTQWRVQPALLYSLAQSQCYSKMKNHRIFNQIAE